MRRTLTINLILFILLNNFIYANSTSLYFKEERLNKNEVKDFKEAELLFDESKFFEAKNIYITLDNKYEDLFYLDYMIGLCYANLYSPESAISYLNRVEKLFPNVEDVRLYLGMSYLYIGNTDSARVFLYSYLDKKEIDDYQIDKAILLIDNCNNFDKYRSSPENVQLKNFGGNVNSAFSEYVPIIMDSNKLLFTYKGPYSIGGKQNKFGENQYGEYNEDIFITSINDSGDWLEPKSIGGHINGLGNEACIALSPDENKLFLYKFSKRTSGDIFVSDKQGGNNWSIPIKLKGDINSRKWEGSAFLLPDNKTLYFSSDRGGGYGGKDIYQAILQTDGSWSDIQNLGPNINTEHDEDAPFLSEDGKLFVFSSKGHNGIGNYDVFYSEIEKGMFLPPNNMGFPTNSVYDDIYYTIKNGTAYYSSSRAGGYGMQDLYLIEPTITDLLNSKNVISEQKTKNNEQLVNLSNNEVATIGFKQDSLNAGEAIIKEYGVRDEDLLFFRVQIAAYENPEKYDYSHLKEMGKIDKYIINESITTFTLGGDFRTFDEADKLRRIVKNEGYQAFVIAYYRGERAYVTSLVEQGLLDNNYKILRYTR